MELVDNNDPQNLHESDYHSNSNDAHQDTPNLDPQPLESKGDYGKLESSDSNLSKKYMKKRGNFIFRQELNSYTPECNAKCGIIYNAVVVLAFLAAAVPIILNTKETYSITFPYTDCSLPAPRNANICKIPLELNQTLQGPVLLYYELNNFYLNHRAFVKSKLWDQLRGEINEDSKSDKCTGAYTMYEMFGNDTTKMTNPWGHTFNRSEVANPCGLFARAFFNDTYALYDSTDNPVFLNDTGIANSYERTTFYKRISNYTISQWIDVQDEHFMVWMAMETFNSFRKLWARIDHDMKPGNYNILIYENYNVSQYNATKSLVLVTSSILGEGSFYGYALLIGAGYCFLVILILWVLVLANRDKKFDINMLKWK